MASRKRRRRTRGEGTIERLPDGRYRVRVSHGVDPLTGNRRRSSRTVATREDAMRVREEMRAIGASVFSPDAREEVAAYLVGSLENIQARQLRPSTLQRYRALVRKWLVPHAPPVSLRDLTPQHVEVWLGAIDDAGAGGRTQEMAYTWLGKTLGLAHDADLIRKNPVLKQHRPAKRTPRKLYPLNADQLEGFLATARGDKRNAALWPVLAVGGLRIGEALALKWARVDLRQGVLEVTETLVELDRGEFRFGEPKTSASVRKVHLGRAMVATLRAHRDACVEEGRPVLGEGLVFATRDGRPLSRRNVRRRLHELLAAAGCPRVRVHDLRHTAATALLVQHGLPPKVVAEQLGHSVETLLRTYAHVMPSQRDDAAAAMDSLMGGTDV